MDVYYYNGRFKCKLIIANKKIQGFQEMVKVHVSEYHIHVRALYILSECIKRIYRHIRV